MTQDLPALPGSTVVLLTMPGVGRVLALRTSNRASISEFLVAEAPDGQNVYLTDLSADGKPPVEYQVEELGQVSEWIGRPERAAAVAAVLALQVDEAPPLGPLAFARAVDVLAKSGNTGTAAAAVEEALQIASACARSEAQTGAEVSRLMGTGS